MTNNTSIYTFDERRNIIIPGNYQTTLHFCIDHFLKTAEESIQHHGCFSVALSGGSTPKAIFQGIVKSDRSKKIDWTKVLVFWSDERCVPLDDAESNYKMAMDAGFSKLPILKENIFPLKGTENLEQNALDYERLINEKISGKSFDLIMLGMGDDGHTASLFPKTHGLHSNARFVIPNFLPQKDVWRMTFTYDCINAAHQVVIYVLGASKASMVKEVFTAAYDPDLLPIQRIGTEAHKALWVLDEAAASELK